MAIVLTDNKHYTDIANEIRLKCETDVTYKPSEMADVIRTIGCTVEKLPLPEGYTQLTYIEATGTQYIDTGYVPNQNTRIILDAHIVPTTSIDPVFGSRTALDGNAFGLWLTAPDAVDPQYGNVRYNTQTINTDYEQRLIYEMNKNVFTVNGITKTFAETTFDSTYPMYLFQINNFGDLFSRYTKGKIYSCKIYDNDVLVRDFVPCKNPSGEVGLYDLVNSAFYGNAGSGIFSGAPLANVAGIPCFVTVETETGAIVDATFEDKIVSTVADNNGIAILILNREGTWNITATLDGETVNTEVVVEHDINEELAFIIADPILENNSWEVISAVAREGKAQEYWNIGDEKPITINGTTNIAQIMDFDMYDVADPTSYGRTKAGIVFQCKNAAAIGTWTFSRAISEAETLISENSDCKDFVPLIKYPHYASNTAFEITYPEGKGILPSEQEVFGTTRYGYGAEGTQYAFYAAGNNKIKYEISGTGVVEWWTRTYINTSNMHPYVDTSEKVARSSSSTFSCYIVPVFCL